MTTTNTCKKCGCEDSFIPSPAPCPTPAGCPTPQPCSEVFDAQCVVYTGPNLTCIGCESNSQVVVNTNTNLNQIVDSLVTYFCQGLDLEKNIECDQTIIAESGICYTEAIQNVVDYFCINTPTPSVQQFQYEIGEYVEIQGGVIFHRWLSTTPFGPPLNGPIQNYLVLDVEYVGDSSTPWGLVGTNVINSESNWDGLTNTNSIIGTPGILPIDAAKLCADSTAGGFTDWYLPAAYELLTLRNNLMDVQRGIIASGLSGASLLPVIHQSSTEIDATNIFTVDFSTGNFVTVTKGSNFYTKAVRKFTI